MRFTPTHSGPDSAGVVRIGNWELEGRAYLYVVAGAVGGVLVFILAVGLGWPLRLALSAMPLLGAVAIVKFFLVNRPPHFAGDWCEGIATGRHFMQSPQKILVAGGHAHLGANRERPGGSPRHRGGMASAKR